MIFLDANKVRYVGLIHRLCKRTQTYILPNADSVQLCELLLPWPRQSLLWRLSMWQSLSQLRRYRHSTNPHLYQAIHVLQQQITLLAEKTYLLAWFYRQISWPADTWNCRGDKLEAQSEGLSILLLLEEGAGRPLDQNRYLLWSYCAFNCWCLHTGIPSLQIMLI